MEGGVPGIPYPFEYFEKYPISIKGNGKISPKFTPLQKALYHHIHKAFQYEGGGASYIYIQGYISLLSKRNEKVLKSEQIVCSQRILKQIQKLRASEASEDNFY